MKFVIVTGMSGAGKTVALKALEDMGYYCVDNLPIPLITEFAQLTIGAEKSENIAIGIDIRNGEELPKMEEVLLELTKKNIAYEILFLDADDDTLIKRYKETRRSHPLSQGGRIENGIEKERKFLSFLREHASCIIDTSRLLTKELRMQLVDIYAYGKSYKNMYVTILSFGFTYGIPQDADLVFDVRFLPNPFYEDSLRLKTGEDRAVVDYVFSDGNADIFLDKLEDMIDFLIPHYITEGKNQLVIGVGCTGGQHRSVAMAIKLKERLDKSLDDKEKIGIKLEHRDADRNIRRIS